MEKEYPTLRRPKRKLCYLTNKKSPHKQWAGTLTLGDVDRMFDDLDPSVHDDDGLLSPSPLRQISDSETSQREKKSPTVSQEGQLTETLPGCQMASEENVLHPATRPPSPKLVLDLDVPFKAHVPVKTSSPIEKNLIREGVEELGNEKDKVLTPIFFACDDEEEEAKKESPLTKKPKCNGSIIEQNSDSEFESPVSRVTLSLPKMSSHKIQTEGTCKESHPDKETTRGPQTKDVKGKREEPRDPPVLAVRQEATASKKKLGSVQGQPSVEVSSCVGKDMSTFLQKLRDAGQPKPAWKFLSPIKAPTPPELEDNFLILEDDTPLWFSIPSKSATSKRQKQSRTSSNEKDSSTDKEAKDSPQETAQKQQESEQLNSKVRSQPVNQKMKKVKEKKNELTEPGNDMNHLPSPEDPPAGEQDKPNKKIQRKKAPSKESEEATATREKDKEKPALKMEKKTQKSSGMKRSKSAKSLKEARKVTQECDFVEETVHVETVKEKNEEHQSTEDLGSLSDKEIRNFEAWTTKKDKQNKLPVVGEGSSSEDGQILGKRKRKQTGQWWLSCPQNTDEAKVTDNQPKLKKSKQTKNNRVLKKINQAEPSPSSRQNKNETKEKKPKQSKKRKTRRETPKMKKSSEVFDVMEAEQFDEEERQREILDQGLEPVESSPLVFAHRDHSLDSGDQVFARVYHQVSHGKMSTTPDQASPRESREQLRAAHPEKRRRNPPSKWWMVNGLSEDVESISSRPQKQEPKPRKQRKKQSEQSRSPGLGTPINGNMAVSSKPLGGAPVPPLKVMPLSAPKTVKRSLATFKDIFLSAAESPTVVTSRGNAQNNKCKVSAHPVVEVTVTDCTTQSKTDEHVLTMDAGEPNSAPNHEAQQDSECQAENTLKPLRSGPSSMVELVQYKENDNLNLSSSRIHAALSTSDLCGPPLKPLTLQPEDKAHLTEWFKSLWSTTVDDGPEITPDHFDWYFYKGRAFGLLVDLNNGSICSGKILLGSYMKKPLWVDHSATTVFNLLTSSVSVTIDASESSFNPGQSFMAPCGHAYSIQNVTAQPAVLYFTRILAENVD